MDVSLATEPEFATVVARHRRELHIHCYRMLGSFDDAEDLVQETFLRAWRGRESFVDGSLRAWLYRIATNVCLDTLRSSARRVPSLGSFADVPWLQPYPDQLLDEIASRDEEPEAVAVGRESIELAFLAAIQLLPPRQRAVLISRDVLEWSAARTASSLDLSVAAVNSALQRARATLREHLPDRSQDWSPAAPTSDERALLERMIDIHERQDAEAAIALMRDDIRVTMPPNPMCFDGIEAVGALLRDAFGPGRIGDWRLLPTQANRLPAAACYLRQPGDTEYRAFKLDVLRFRDGAVAEITTFGAQVFPAFGLAPVLPQRW